MKCLGNPVMFTSLWVNSTESGRRLHRMTCQYHFNDHRDKFPDPRKSSLEPYPITFNTVELSTRAGPTQFNLSWASKL